MPATGCSERRINASQWRIISAATNHRGAALVAFSPRKQNLTVYIMPGFKEFPGLMKKLGIYKTGKSCLYLKKLQDVDANVLQRLITESVRLMRKRYKLK